MTCFRCQRERSILTRTKPQGQPGEFTCPQCLDGEPEPEPKGEQMTCEQQLSRWVDGDSVHNDTRDECCPDFSCCEPTNQWAKERRQEFAEAHRSGDDEKAHGMLLGSLGRMIAESDTEAKAHVAGTIL